MTPRPLRLLYLAHQFYPEYRNGTEKFVLQLAQSMQSRGHQVLVVAYRVGGLRGWQQWRRWFGVNFWQQHASYAGVPVLALRHWRRPPAYHREVADEAERAFARRFLQKWRPDLVHVGHAMRVSGFVWAAQDLGIPTVFTLTDYWLICPKIILVNSQDALCAGPAQGLACQRDCPDLSPDFVARRLALTATLVRQAACVVAPSRQLAEVFQREWPWLTPQVVPHGVEPWTQNQRLVGPGSRLVFAYAGSLTRHKGVHILIEAFRGVQSATARLRIYGAGPDAAALRTQAAADARVEFCGVYSEHEAAQVFAAMDVLVAPSLWPENRPFVVCEALASGVPVVASQIGSMAEVVAHGVNGLTVPPGDVRLLQAALQGLVDQPEQINMFNTAAGAVAIPAVAAEADAYAAIYRRVNRIHFLYGSEYTGVLAPPDLQENIR